MINCNSGKCKPKTDGQAGNIVLDSERPGEYEKACFTRVLKFLASRDKAMDFYIVYLK